jgi:ligand-binding sensor domain-containing protein
MKLSETEIDWQLGVQNYYSFTCLTVMSDGQIIAGSEKGITLIDQDNHTLTREIPNAPLTNQISAVTVLNDGRLVAGSRYGLSIKEHWGWRNIAQSDEIILSPAYDETRFAVDYVPIFFGGFVADIEQGPDGLLYCAIRGTYPEPRRHGGGIIIIDIDNPENFTLIDTAVLDYYADEYMVVKDLEFDASGILWVADTYATTRGNPISVMTTNKSWGSFNVTNSGNILSYTPNTIGFDSFDRIWIGSFEDDLNTSPARNGGLVYLDYEGSVINPSSTVWGSVEINPGYSNNTVWSLAVNDEDILYALTPIGLLQLTLQFSNADPVKKYGYVYFPNISHGKGSKVHLDSRNNVWTTSPTQGVHVLTSGSTYWPDINGFKRDNSQLLSNEVADIAFNNDEGLAYIATSQGISVLRMPFAVQNDSYNKTRVFPSPYHLPSSSPLVIDGLMDESTCKIMTVTGRVIRTLLVSSAGVNGYQAYWDGKDSKGRWADTGVYLISIYRDSGESGFEKIAVIQH